MTTLKKYLLLIMILNIITLYGCGSGRDDTMGGEVNTLEEETTTTLGEHSSREPTMAIKDEKTALAIGTIILKNYFEYFYESLFEIQDKDEYWFVYSYIPDPIDENGERIGWSVGGGFSVTFRKSDCKIIDIGIED